MPAEIRKLARAGASAPPERRFTAISAAPAAILIHFAVYTCQALTARDSASRHHPRFEVTIASLPFSAASPQGVISVPTDEHYVAAMGMRDWNFRHVVCRSRPESAGKMNFYLSAVDDMLRHPEDKPGVGLILCKAKNGIVAGYALRYVGKPLSIAEFRHLEKLPEQLKGTLPTIEKLRPSWQGRKSQRTKLHLRKLQNRNA